MAQPMRKLLFAAAGGLLASLMIGTISAAAEEYDIQDSILHLNSFIVTDSGNRVLTGSCEADQITESGWYVSDDDSLYYYYSDGSCAQDETTLNDGYTYLFASDGALRTGWQTVDGKRYYYSAEVGQPVFGWMDYQNAMYYIDKTAGKLTGVQTIDGIPYTFDEYGCAVTGWVSYADGSLYFYNTDASTATGWAVTENGTYYLTADKGAVTGRYTIDGKEYYFGDDKKLKTGWIDTDSGKMWADANGVLAKGMVSIDGKTHCFDAQGYALTGVCAIDGITYYTDANGAVQTGIQQINDKYYYFNEQTGALQTGWITVNGVQYYFDPDEAYLRTGWLETENGTMYLTTSGAATGIQTIDGGIYGFNAKGILLTDWQTVNGKLYCFNPTNGKALTGWTTKDSSKIYLNADGTAASGVTVIGDKTYYFDPSTFAMRTGWITIGDSSSYFDPTTGVLTETGHAPVQLNVVDYKQFDSKWSNKVINYSTIGKVGCVTTALAMKYSYQTNTNTTPDKMVSKLTYSSDNLIWSSCTKLGYTVDNASGTISQSVMQKIYDKLLSNKPVVIGAKKSDGSQHYVLVTGYTGSKGTTFSAENFIINDPGSSKRTKLSEYLALFPNLYKLIY